MKAYLCCLALVLFYSVLASPQQLQHTGKTETQNRSHDQADHTEVEDPLGRSTPHGTVFGFLQASQSGKNKEAAQYLQLTGQQRAREGERIAQKLHALMDSAFVGRVGTISNDREGSVQPDIPKDHERIGTFKMNGRETEVDLVRVTDSSGAEIWLFSSQVLAAVPELYEQLEASGVESRLPSFLVTNQVFSTPLWRVMSLLLLIPVSFVLAWGIVHLLRAGQRIWLRWRHHPVVEDIHKSFTGPAILILTVVFNEIGISLLGTPLLIREYYRRATGVALLTGIAWLIIRVINRWGERARQRSLVRPGYRSGSLILLGQRIVNVLVVIVAGLIMLSLFGVDITAAVAGLGIGSIAIAFAAQKTLENLLGGISILGDQVIRVGEVCRIGDNVGTVEDISLRSTRIRTVAGTALSVPNGQLANMNVENITRRRKSLFEARIGLRTETSSEHLRSVVEDMRDLLQRHPKVDPEIARVHFVEFGESSLDIEIDCLLLTGSLGEFLALREELLLKIMDLLASAGVQLATPARLLQISREQDPERISREWLKRQAS